MLTALRSRTAGWVAKAFMAILVLSFAVWGIEDMFRGRSTQNVAEVGSTSISASDYRMQFDAALNMWQARTGQYIAPAQARSMGIDQQVLDQVINQAALREQARNYGLNASREAVIDAIRQDPMFQGSTGQFNPAALAQLLQQNRMTEQTYIELYRQDIPRMQLAGALTLGIETPRPMLQLLHRYMMQARSIDYVELRPEDLGEIALPAQGELEEFFKNRVQAFNAPEYRSISLLTLKVDDLTDPATVSEEDARAEYERSIASYSTPSRSTIDVLRFPSIEEAAEARARLNETFSFDNLVTERGETLQNITLGALDPAKVIDSAVGQAATGLAEGGVSEPVNTITGPALVRVRDVTTAARRPFEDVRDEIVRQLAASRARTQLNARHDDIDRDIGTGMTLKEISEKYGLGGYRLIEAVDAEGRDAEGNPVETPHPDLVGNAFEAAVGLENDILRLGNDGYAWFVVESVDPARPRTFEEARSRVEAAWRTEETTKRLDIRSGELLESVRASGLAAVARELGQEIRNASNITRDSVPPELGRAMAREVFATPLHGYGTANGVDGTTRIVFNVTGETLPEFDPASPALASSTRNVADRIEREIVSAYVQQLRSRLGVSVNRAAIEAALGGDGL